MSSNLSSGSPKKKGGPGRLVDRSRPCGRVQNSFVSGTNDISRDLVIEVSGKANEFYMTFSKMGAGNEYYHGQGGFIRGRLLPAGRDDDGQPHQQRRRLAFAQDLSYEATPVTAKHNLENAQDENYLRTTVKCSDQLEKDVALPNGGCTMTETIQIRPSTTTTLELRWEAEDISKGETITDPSNPLTKASRLFEAVSHTFVDHSSNIIEAWAPATQQHKTDQASAS